jgi:iron complex transport system substrate-binding protein
LKRLAIALSCILLLAASGAGAEARVATLLPSVEAALKKTPGDFLVVATVRRSLHSPAPEGMIDLGNPHSPSFERLAEARPTLVVGDAAIHAALAEKLKVNGAEVMLLDTRGVDSTLAGLDEVGKRVGVAPAMNAQTRQVKARLAELALAAPLPTLAVFGAPGSFLVVTERTWLGDLLGRLEFSNVAPAPEAGADERFAGLITLSDERFAGLRPELVLLVAHGDPSAIKGAFEQRTAAGGPWSGVRAKASRGVHILDPGLFATNPGLDLVRAAEELVALTQPPSVSAAQPADADESRPADADESRPADADRSRPADAGKSGGDATR